MNDRQEKALQRILGEGPGGFEGGLTITSASPAAVTRDLIDLADNKGALIRTGERRHAHCSIAISWQRC